MPNWLTMFIISFQNMTNLYNNNFSDLLQLFHWLNMTNLKKLELSVMLQEL